MGQSAQPGRRQMFPQRPVHNLVSGAHEASVGFQRIGDLDGHAGRGAGAGVVDPARLERLAPGEPLAVVVVRLPVDEAIHDRAIRGIVSAETSLEFLPENVMSSVPASEALPFDVL